MCFGKTNDMSTYFANSMCKLCWICTIITSMHFSIRENIIPSIALSSCCSKTCWLTKWRRGESVYMCFKATFGLKDGWRLRMWMMIWMKYCTLSSLCFGETTYTKTFIAKSMYVLDYTCIIGHSCPSGSRFQQLSCVWFFSIMMKGPCHP